MRQGIDEDFEISDDIEELPTTGRVMTTEFDNAKGDAFDSDRKIMPNGRNLPKMTKLAKNFSLNNAEDCLRMNNPNYKIDVSKQHSEAIEIAHEFFEEEIQLIEEDEFPPPQHRDTEVRYESPNESMEIHPEITPFGNIKKSSAMEPLKNLKETQDVKSESQSEETDSDSEPDYLNDDTLERDVEKRNEFEQEEEKNQEEFLAYQIKEPSSVFNPKLRMESSRSNSRLMETPE
jgi:hypothetical protein